MSENMTKSEKLYERAVKVLPGGISRNALYKKPQPSYVKSASGFTVTDVEGVSRIDFANNMASLIHGHAHPKITEAVTAQLKLGTTYSMAHEIEIKLAEHLNKRNPNFEKMRFMNSGNEAVMTLIKIARAATGRFKIAKIEGAYHGTYEFAEVSQNSNPENWGSIDKPSSVPVAFGTPQSILDHVVVIPFNDTERTIKILDEHRSELACVLIDPIPHRVGMAPAKKEYIKAIYDWTRKDASLLAFDEVITLRVNYGGAQVDYSEVPDITAMGKIIGGGFPVGAVAGKNEIMKVLDPRETPLKLPHSGTFSANPITMVAGLTAMELFSNDEVKRLNALGDRARKQILEAIKASEVRASLTGAGSFFRIHLKAKTPWDYRSAYQDKKGASVVAKFLDALLNEGFMMLNTLTGTISTPMGNNEIDKFTEAVYKTFKKLKPEIEEIAYL